MFKLPNRTITSLSTFFLSWIIPKISIEMQKITEEENITMRLAVTVSNTESPTWPDISIQNARTIKEILDFCPKDKAHKDHHAIYFIISQTLPDDNEELSISNETVTPQKATRTIKKEPGSDVRVKRETQTAMGQNVRPIKIEPGIKEEPNRTTETEQQDLQLTANTPEVSRKRSRTLVSELEQDDNEQIVREFSTEMGSSLPDLDAVVKAESEKPNTKQKSPVKKSRTEQGSRTTEKVDVQASYESDQEIEEERLANTSTRQRKPIQKKQSLGEAKHRTGSRTRSSRTSKRGRE